MNAKKGWGDFTETTDNDNNNVWLDQMILCICPSFNWCGIETL